LDDPPLDWTAWAGILSAVVVGAMFAALNDALHMLGEVRLRAARESEGPQSKIAARLLANRERVAATLLLGRVLCVAFGGASLVCFRLASLATWQGVVKIIFFSLSYSTVAEIVTTLARTRLNGGVFVLFKLIRPIEWVLFPLVMPLLAISRLTQRLFPAKPEEDGDRVTKLEVEQLIEHGEEQGHLTQDHAALLLSVLEFKDTVAREVMVPRTQMVAIELNTPLDEVFQLIIERGHSRYPVYRERIDQVEGVLYAKDLFRVTGQKGTSSKTLSDLIKKPFFTAGSQKIGNLLHEMQSRRVHLAVVVDEFGGVNGIVTLEDILEEIVGEIRDEHDKEEAQVQRLSEAHYLAKASISISDLEEVMRERLPKVQGEHESLGGMIIDLAGKVPEVGCEIELAPYKFVIKEADERHIKEVEIKRLQNDSEEAAE